MLRPARSGTFHLAYTPCAFVCKLIAKKHRACTDPRRELQLQLKHPRDRNSSWFIHPSHHHHASRAVHYNLRQRCSTHARTRRHTRHNATIPLVPARGQCLTEGLGALQSSKRERIRQPCSEQVILAKVREAGGRARCRTVSRHVYMSCTHKVHNW